MGVPLGVYMRGSVVEENNGVEDGAVSVAMSLSELDAVKDFLKSETLLTQYVTAVKKQDSTRHFIAWVVEGPDSDEEETAEEKERREKVPLAEHEARLAKLTKEAEFLRFAVIERMDRGEAG